jgi:hypothetical protein
VIQEINFPQINANKRKSKLFIVFKIGGYLRSFTDDIILNSFSERKL